MKSNDDAWLRKTMDMRSKNIDFGKTVDNWDSCPASAATIARHESLVLSDHDRTAFFYAPKPNASYGERFAGHRSEPSPDERTGKFYDAHGFIRLSESMRLILPTRTIATLIQP